MLYMVDTKFENVSINIFLQHPDKTNIKYPHKLLSQQGSGGMNIVLPKYPHLVFF